MPWVISDSEKDTLFHYSKNLLTIYTDNIPGHGCSKEKQGKHLEESLKQQELTAPSSAKQNGNSASFLGHTFSQGKLYPDPAKDSYGRTTTSPLQTETRLGTINNTDILLEVV